MIREYYEMEIILSCLWIENLFWGNISSVSDAEPQGW